MLEKNRSLLLEVYRLAKIRRLKDEESSGTGIKLLSDVLGDAQELRQESELWALLTAQDLETLQMIEAIMYIGRDFTFDDIAPKEQDYDAESECYDEWVEDQNKVFGADDNSRSVDNPEELIRTWMISLADNHTGEDRKFLVANQIYEKIPLDEYIARGCKLLGT